MRSIFIQAIDCQLPEVGKAFARIRMRIKTAGKPIKYVLTASS